MGTTDFSYSWSKMEMEDRTAVFLQLYLKLAVTELD